VVRGFPDFYRPVGLAEQRIGVATKGEWEVLCGFELTLVGLASNLAGGGSAWVIVRTTPNGKEFYVTDIHTVSKGPDHPPAHYHLYKDGTLLLPTSTNEGAPSVHPPFMVPYRFIEGEVVRAYIENLGTVAGDFYFVVHGYEVSV